MTPRPIRAALTALAAFAPAAPAPAPAQERPSSVAMTCAQAAALVRGRGALVLGTGERTYDRFVSDGAYCAPTQATKIARVPTRDDPACPIGFTCYEPGASKDGG